VGRSIDLLEADEVVVVGTVERVAHSTADHRRRTTSAGRDTAHETSAIVGGEGDLYRTPV
jgi:hypothetical protein